VLKDDMRKKSIKKIVKKNNLSQLELLYFSVLITAHILKIIVSAI
jgi:hypothetical protein